MTASPIPIEYVVAEDIVSIDPTPNGVKRVVLRKATCAFFESKGLFAFLEVDEQDGREQRYAQRFPTPEDREPPAWASLARLTRTSTDDLLASWSEDEAWNPTAHAVVLRLSEYVGRTFSASEVTDGDRTALELLVLEPNAVPDVEKQESDGSAVSANIEVEVREDVVSATLGKDQPRELLHTSTGSEVIRRVPWSKIRVASGEPGEPTDLVMELIGVEPALWPKIRVPDRNQRDDRAWWFVEVFTGVSAETISRSWEKGEKNESLNKAHAALAQALSGVPVPLAENGVPNLDLFRAQALPPWRVRDALNLPFLCPTRPDVLIQRGRTLLREVWPGRLFRFGAEGRNRGVPALVLPHDGRTELEVLDDEIAMRGIFTRRIRYGTAEKSSQPPRELLCDLIRFPDERLPVIERIERIPTMRPDGTILDQEGYDPLSRIWFAPDLVIERVPDKPTSEDLAKARKLLEEPIAEFPFAANEDRVAYFALLMELVTKTMIAGPRPLYAIDAPIGGQGTGKSTLAKMAYVLATGDRAGTITSLGAREEEIEKRITSLLLAGSPFVIADNLTSTVGSPALMQLATSERWQGRKLGVSESPSLPQSATWVMTLNGALLVRDIARRTVLVRLDVQASSRPDHRGVKDAWERRNFTIKDPIGWVFARRAELIRALLVLARSWVVAGRPEDPELVRGSFESWAAVVGGILHHAGYRGLMQALRNADGRDPHMEDHLVLVRTWAAEQPGTALSAASLGELAKRRGLYEDVLLERCVGVSLGKRMGALLKTILGRDLDGHRVEQHAEVAGCKTYRLAPARSS